jgi:predicted dehydrogenase
MLKKLMWGVVGTGGIAGDFAEALGASERGRVVNVVGTSAEKAAAFAQKWNVAKSAATLEEMLADKSVEAVYVASPHPSHEGQAIACIEAGKHVLCEKPMTIDGAGAERVIAAARRRGVFLMEAFMYRCHPLMRDLLARLRAGVIGDIRHIRADFGFRVPRNPTGRLFDVRLGGGGILDVGGYPMSFARLIAGLIEGKPFAEPTRLEGAGFLGPTGADEVATALLWFSSGLTAELTSAVHHDIGTTTVVFREAGKIVIPNPWIPGGQRQGRDSSFTIHRDDGQPDVVPIRTERATYALEAELVADTLPQLEPSPPAMTWADSLGNMRALDRWRAAVAAKRSA